jgi:signal peptidase I
MSRGVWHRAGTALLAAAGLGAIRWGAFVPCIVNGGSMVPTLHAGDYVLVERLSPRLAPIPRGALVVIKKRQDRFVKRVLGLPGETVRLENGVLTVMRQSGSGKAEVLDEPYVGYSVADSCE